MDSPYPSWWKSVYIKISKQNWWYGTIKHTSLMFKDLKWEVIVDIGRIIDRLWCNLLFIKYYENTNED